MRRSVLGNEHSPGHSHVLDIDRRHFAEPVFNGCKSMPSLVDKSCIWAAVEVIPRERVGLKGHMHLSIPVDMQTTQPAHYATYHV